MKTLFILLGQARDLLELGARLLLLLATRVAALPARLFPWGVIAGIALVAGPHLFDHYSVDFKWNCTEGPQE